MTNAFSILMGIFTMKMLTIVIHFYHGYPKKPALAQLILKTYAFFRMQNWRVATLLK